MSVLLVIFIVVMILWLLTLLPAPQTRPYAAYNGLLAFIAVLVLFFLCHGLHV